MKTICMPREMHQKWDKALRSGKYKQGKGTLFNSENNSYCCLGVLQKAVAGAAEARRVPSGTWLAKHGITFDIRRLGDVAEVPWLPALGCHATTANDECPYSFVEIADAIADCVEYTD